MDDAKIHLKRHTHNGVYWIKGFFKLRVLFISPHDTSEPISTSGTKNLLNFLRNITKV